MADALIALEVATPEGMALKAVCTSVGAPSVNGEFTVLPGHLPLLASLRCGLLTYIEEGKNKVAAVGPGFVDAEPDKVQLLTDLFALPSDIDVEAARKERDAAGAALKKFDKDYDGPEYQELVRDLEWAEAKLNARELADR